MKDYTTDFFTYFGCALQQDGKVLSVHLTPELAQYFGKSTLRLVFQPEHLEKQTELVTHGSYLANRISDLLKSSGAKVSVTLPKRVEELPTVGSRPSAEGRFLPSGINCTIKKHRSREIRKTEVYLIFRITYASDEIMEEIITARIDFAGNIHITPEFPYPLNSLKDAEASRFPFTRKQAQGIYDQCVKQVETYAAQQALTHQEKFAQPFHENVARLEAYYQQMIDEIPVLEKNREGSIRQLQAEYALKIADEVKKCQIHVTLTPISFCTITIPFRQDRYTLQTNGASVHRQGVRGEKASSLHPSAEVTVNVFHNLFSGEVFYPRCESCGKEMKQIGVCEISSHPVCHNCLVECHVCGTRICRNCGIDVCFECGEWVCQQCSEQCHICGERYCAQHLLGCSLCREHFCRQCSESCEVCGKPVEKTHLTACAISHKPACPACIGVCSCCRKQVSQAYLSFCAFCGQQACTECTFHCEVCGETFCVHHISECDLTKHLVCPRHAGVCESCGHHVSTKSLSKCDVCGKTVCTRCATRCSHCHTVFCKEDAGDIVACPECGKMYCALCYSTHSCR